MRLALKFGRGVLLRPEAKSGRGKAVEFPHYFTIPLSLPKAAERTLRLPFSHKGREFKTSAFLF